MKKLNKIVSLAMAATMTFSLAACGKTVDTPVASSDAGTSPAPAVSTDTPSVDAASGLTHINVYRALFNNASPDEASVKKVEDAINAYIADKIGVEISLKEVGSGEYTEKANLALQGKEINLLWTASWESTIGTNDLVPINASYDITDLLPGTDLYNSMDAGQWEASKYNGRNYFIPVYKDNVEGYDFMFRKDLVDKFGWDITTVKSLADLEPMLADAKGDGLKYPLLLQKTAMFYRWGGLDKFDFFTGDVKGNFVSVSRATNEVVDTILTPEYAEFCKLMAKYAEAGYISEDEVNKVTTDTTTQSQDWAISWWTDLPNNGEANGRYGQEVVMQPATSRWAHSTSNLGSCYTVTSNSTEEEAKACIAFLGLMFTDTKLADMYTYGIEGENFNYKDGLVAKVADTPYNHSMWESASATVVTAEVESPYTPDMYLAFNGGANASCAAGFRFDRGPVDDKYTACQNIFDEYGFPLETGGVALADVDAKIAAYQAALDAAGYQDVLAEFQRQYNEWKK